MTLTETAQITKRGLRAVIILGAFFLILWIIFLYVYNNFYLPKVKATQKPEKQFGTIPQPSMPPSIASSSNFTYSLDTESGYLPSGFPRLVKIYLIPPKTISLLAPDRAQKLALTLGFPSTAQILTSTLYSFKDSSGGELTIDLNSGNFHIIRKITQPDAEQIAELPDNNQISKEFRDYLSSKGLLTDSLSAGTSKVTYDQTSAKSSATAIIGLWPEKQDKLPIVGKDINKGFVSATVTKYTQELQKYTTLDYALWPIDSTTASTYEIIPVSQSFENLKKGFGVVIQKPTGNTVSIHSVYLAYYMSNEFEPYLQPVYVYQGDNFLAYVLALTPDSYK